MMEAGGGDSAAAGPMIPRGMKENEMANGIAMARQGTQYSDPEGRFSISWPLGGERQVLDMPADTRDGAVARRILDGMIEETSDKANTKMEESRYGATVFQGKAAREYLARKHGEITFTSHRINEEMTIEAAKELVQPPHATSELEDVRDLDDVTVPQLKKIAAAEDVDLAGLRKKDEIAEAIREHRADEAEATETPVAEAAADETVDADDADDAEADETADDETADETDES